MIPISTRSSSTTLPARAASAPAATSACWPKAAPATAVGTSGAAGALGAAANAAGGSSAAGLSSLSGAFSKLNLKPEMIAKAVPVLTSFVTKSGGADVGQLLAGALK